MADATPRHPIHPDWSDAFAAMPLERAPADAWARLSSALPAPAPTSSAVHRRSGRWPVVAAAASVAIALPVAWWLLVSPGAGPSPEAGVEAEPPAMSTAGVASATSVVSAAPSLTNVPRVDLKTDDVRASAVVTSSRRTPDVRAIAAATGSPAARDKRPARDQHASGADAAIRSHVLTPPNVDADPALADTYLDALRQESARLEALVAYARDDRMSSAPAAVMTASLDDRIRLIDAALMQADVGDAMRSSLWGERVDALQELAALEGTQRWMAAHGTSMDAVARVD